MENWRQFVKLRRGDGACEWVGVNLFLYHREVFTSLGLSVVILPCANRRRPVTTSITMAIILATVKIICILVAHFTLAQFTNNITPVRC